MSDRPIKQTLNDKWDQHPNGRCFVFVDETKDTGRKRVGTTGFVRHRRPMEGLLGALESLPREKDLRILSAPCSIGCEPYSLAMIAEETGIYKRRALTIDALDISPLFVATAREGIYPAGMLSSNLPPEMRRHFHEAGDDMMALDDAIKSRVNVLPAQDLTTMQPQKPYDALIILNLLIQLNDAAIAEGLATAIERMAPSAILMNNAFLVKRDGGERRVVPYAHWDVLENMLCDNGYVTADSQCESFSAYGQPPRGLQKAVTQPDDGTFLFVKPGLRI